MQRLTDDQKAIRDKTREFVRTKIAPFAAQWDRTATVPLETVKAIGALGLFGICIPVEWGGAGADFVSYVLAIEELAYGDAGICNTVAANNAFGFRVRDFGAPEQKERFLRPVAVGSEIGCLLLTEPQAGSDAANLSTSAQRRGDVYVINGTKNLITSGRSANAAILLAVTDPGAGKRRISGFLIRTDWPGYRVLREETKLGHRTNDTCQIVLEDLEVPAENLLGAPGQGLKMALSGIESGRIGVAAQSVGVARAAFDAAFQHARKHQKLDNILMDHQAVSFKLAEMATEIEAARQMCYHAASMKQDRVRCVKQSSMSKLFASQMCERVCSSAIDIYGYCGFPGDCPVEKLYRDARVFQIYDGANEVQKIVIARELVAGH